MYVYKKSLIEDIHKQEAAVLESESAGALPCRFP